MIVVLIEYNEVKIQGPTVCKILCGASRYSGEAVQLLDPAAPLLEYALVFGRRSATRLLHPLVRFHISRIISQKRKFRGISARELPADGTLLFGKVIFPGNDGSAHVEDARLVCGAEGELRRRREVANCETKTQLLSLTALNGKFREGKLLEVC